jgi:LysR family hydrogen peroxide-inducible transcriptional activator
VVRTGSFTKAAEDLGIAQPSLSEQIARLEHSLGAPLFERLHRRIELTALGEAILGKAKALVEDAAALPDLFDQARAGVRGPLRVGAIPTILPYYLAPKLRGFLDRYPDVDLHVREGRTAELVEQVLEGVIDVAVLSLPVGTAGLVMKELFRDPLYCACKGEDGTSAPVHRGAAADSQGRALFAGRDALPLRSHADALRGAVRSGSACNHLRTDPGRIRREHCA